jgi:hypothetical protein
LRDLDLIAVLPRIARGRARVLDAVRFAVPRFDPTGLRGFPWTIAVRAFTRATTLELAGDPVEAGAWRAVFARYDRVLSDPRVQLALYITAR